MAGTERAGQDRERLNVIGFGFSELLGPLARQNIADNGVVMGDDRVIPPKRRVIDGDGLP